MWDGTLKRVRDVRIGRYTARCSISRGLLFDDIIYTYIHVLQPRRRGCDS